MLSFSPVRMKKIFDAIVPALCLFLASLGSFAFAAYPIYIIRPFREQTPVGLERALWVLLHSKPVVLVAALLITALVVVLWRRTGWGTKLVLVPTVVIAFFAAAVSWINPYEQMFHPLGAPHYIPANQASIAPNDMVIAVQLGGESRAYPIREMGYHHVVNDRLHQLPIVVTY